MKTKSIRLGSAAAWLPEQAYHRRRGKRNVFKRQRSWRCRATVMTGGFRPEPEGEQRPRIFLPKSEMRAICGPTRRIECAPRRAIGGELKGQKIFYFFRRNPLKTPDSDE
jgi:hypothetical protein